MATNDEREIVLTRVFDAPRALVFAAWMDVSRLERWFGPAGFTITTHSADIREGGSWRFTMHGPDGTDFPNRHRFVRIVDNELIEKLVDTGVDNDPREFRSTVTFEDAGGKTRLTMRTVLATAEQRAAAVGFGAIELGNQTLEKLGEHVAKTTFEFSQTKPEARIRRVFDAPRDLVWLALTRPEHFVKWWGPHGSEVVECSLDLRVGGSWRAVIKTPEGFTAGFRGEYREIVPPQKIVQTFVFDGVPTEHSVETMTLTEAGNQTILEVHAVHTSMANIEAMMKSGMERGARQTYDRLEDHLRYLGKPVELTRVFDAPVAMVYQAWTDPRLFARWFAPHGFEVVDVTLEPRAGGRFAFTHVFQGKRAGVAGTFREVVPDQRLALAMRFVDPSGASTSPEMSPGWPAGREIHIVVTFAEHSGKTTMTVKQWSPGEPNAAVADNLRLAGIGWRQTLERLREVLARRDHGSSRNE